MSASAAPARTSSTTIEQRAAAALLIANLLFAAGGLIGHSQPTAFGLLYLLSACAAVPAVYFLISAVSGPGSGLLLAGALLFGLSALGHAAEGALTMTRNLSVLGTHGPIVGAAETLALIPGMLLIAIGLWRARIVPIWPALLFLLILPAEGALPHGIAQQAARSSILVLVTAWLALALAHTKTAAPDQAGQSLARHPTRA